MAKRSISDSGLVSAERPGSLDVTGQQRELFPFDAFEYVYNEETESYLVRLKSPWQFEIEGVTASQLISRLEGTEETADGEIVGFFQDGAPRHSVTFGSIRMRHPSMKQMRFTDVKMKMGPRRVRSSGS